MKSKARSSVVLPSVLLLLPGVASLLAGVSPVYVADSIGRRPPVSDAPAGPQPPLAADCWIDREIPTTADQQPVTSPRVAGPRAAAHRINEVLKANTALRGLPEVRWRSTWQVTGHPDRTGDPYGVHLVLWAHGPEMWVGDCDLRPEADRVGPLAAIVVQTNSVVSTLAQRTTHVRDGILEAFVEPEVVGRIAGHPVYRGQWIVLTADGRVPWIPVSMQEYLDFEERRLVAAEAETARGIAEAQQSAGRLDEDALGEAYEAMRAVDPEEAERFLEMMEEVRREIELAAAQAAPVTNAYTQALTELRTLRASLGPAQLSEQARDGYLSIAPPAPVETLPTLVKLDPAGSESAGPSDRIRMMELHYSGRGEPYAELMEEVARTLDWDALVALLR